MHMSFWWSSVVCDYLFKGLSTRSAGGLTFLFGAEISLWFLLQNLGYILMLSVMLYNGWLFLSAVLGGGLGHFIFGQKFMKINLQNCQIIRDTFCMRKCGEPETAPASRDGESTPALETAPPCHEVTVNVHAECNS
ncbi:copper transporter 5.1 [Asbolus verrucosus]|uniref:Copper transport protein n=1 Tax=Asbolus verrucosus TaxID=1661398 RepID=A0A482VX83_ASBVE|nr:copper transporter 5.1 [Asbolus verrucosus]